MEPESITESRLKIVIYLAVCAGFVALGVVGLTHPSANSPLDRNFAWLPIVFFGLGVPVFCWMLVRPQTLKLDVEGFTLDGGFARKPYRVFWRDIEPFFVFKMSRGGAMAGFNYLSGRRPQTALSAMSHNLGADGALPKAWTLSTEALVAKLNDYRDRALAFQGRWAKVEP